MKLRAATEEDMPRLYEIHRDALGPYVEATWGWDEKFQSQGFRERRVGANRQVVEEDGQIAGFMEVQQQADRIVLGTIALAPEFQGRGIGTRLISQLLARSRESGLPVYLRVLKCNRASALYERLGFQAAGQTGTHVLMRTMPAG